MLACGGCQVTRAFGSGSSFRRQRLGSWLVAASFVTVSGVQDLAFAGSARFELSSMKNPAPRLAMNTRVPSGFTDRERSRLFHCVIGWGPYRPANRNRGSIDAARSVALNGN